MKNYDGEMWFAKGMKFIANEAVKEANKAMRESGSATLLNAIEKKAASIALLKFAYKIRKELGIKK